MTRFEMELSGKLGDFWKRDAEKRIADMQEQADNGEILLDENAAAYWKKSGHYLPSDCVEILSYCAFFFDAEATEKAREIEDDRYISEYRKARQNYVLSAEERFEMEAAFGKGAKVVDVFTGQEFII